MRLLLAGQSCLEEEPGRVRLTFRTCKGTFQKESRIYGFRPYNPPSVAAFLYPQVWGE